MKKQYPGLCGAIVWAVGLLAGVSVNAGSLDPAGAPEDPGSAMYNLNDVYQRLDSGIPGAKRTSGFVEPTNAPSGTGYSLDDVMAKAPATNANAATAGDVVVGKIFWGLDSAEWGPRTGTYNTNRIPPDPVPKTGQTTSYQVGDDGDLQTGANLPDPRFTEGAGTSSNCVTDNLTGLMWLRNPDYVGSWSSALSYCDVLDGANGRGDYTDWRMPNWNELRSLIDASKSDPALPAGHPFTGVQSSNYWSSTTVATNTDLAWLVNLSVGSVSGSSKVLSGTSHMVWPVRGQP